MSDPNTEGLWTTPPPGERAIVYRITHPDGTYSLVEALRAVTMAPAPQVPGPLVLFSTDGRPTAIFAPGHWATCIAEP